MPNPPDSATGRQGGAGSEEPSSLVHGGAPPRSKVERRISPELGVGGSTRKGRRRQPSRRRRGANRRLGERGTGWGTCIIPHVQISGQGMGYTRNKFGIQPIPARIAALRNISNFFRPNLYGQFLSSSLSPPGLGTVLCSPLASSLDRFQAEPAGQTELGPQP